MSAKGIAFNFISEFVDYKYDGLYYQSINSIINYIVNNLSRHFTIDHSSPLYEFTICVYRENILNLVTPIKNFKSIINYNSVKTKFSLPKKSGGYIKHKIFD